MDKDSVIVGHPAHGAVSVNPGPASLGRHGSPMGQGPSAQWVTGAGIPRFRTTQQALALFNCAAPPTAHPLLLLVLRYIINAVPAPPLYLNNSHSLLATHP